MSELKRKLSQKEYILKIVKFNTFIILLLTVSITKLYLGYLESKPNINPFANRLEGEYFFCSGNLPSFKIVHPEVTCIFVSEPGLIVDEHPYFVLL